MINKSVRESEAERLSALFEEKKQVEKAKGNDFGQKDIAQIGGWTQPNVSSYLRGKVELKEDSASIFSQALGVPISDFSSRLAEKIQMRELLSKNPLLNKVSIAYVPKYDLEIVSEIRFHLKDVTFSMPMSKETTPIVKNISPNTFSLEIEDSSLESTYKIGTTFIFDPMIDPKPTDIVLVGHKKNPNDLHFRSYKVTEITEDGGEIYELEALNPAYPTLKMNYEVIAVAISAQKDLR